ncbi:MAG: prolyl oligopeptidase family serine peptidase [Verrucomicrobiae bacterium]|nr:prolyl oligopeptidase family serine peptidase [Verrucomicrobiae bacterium]
MIEPQKITETTKNSNYYCALCTFLRPITDFIPVLVVLIFLGALLWAKEQDPFSRKWFTLKTSDGNSIKCVVVLPKPVCRRPVVVYAHGWRGNLMNDGSDLRQMAELGLAVISLEYDQTNEAAFPAEMMAVQNYLARQRWANTNAVAWVGFSHGAINTLSYALQYPAGQPRLLVQLSGAGLSEQETGDNLNSLQCPVLLIHGDQDEIFPVADTKRLAAMLQTKGVPVASEIISGLLHGMEPERSVVFRNIGEYCRMQLMGKDAWVTYHSIAQWQAEASPFWMFCLPTAGWAVGWLIWWWKLGRRGSAALPARPIARSQMILRWVAGVLVVWALTETAVHLLPPHFVVSERTLAIAQKVLVQPKEKADFEFLAAQPIWHGQKLKTLLDHVELANYNRELINWLLEDKIYRDFVLSPVIHPDLNPSLNWRRPLWEEFYPRIRHESSPEDAAKIVVRHLRERVTIARVPNLPHDVPDIWLKQITDDAGFQIITVAALRSVGVPAHLDTQGQAEFYDGNKWQPAPLPSVVSWLQ